MCQKNIHIMDDVECSRSLKRSLRRIRRSKRMLENQQEYAKTSSKSTSSYCVKDENKRTDPICTTVIDNTVDPISSHPQYFQLSTTVQGGTHSQINDSIDAPSAFVRQSTTRRNRRSRKSTTSRSSDNTDFQLQEDSKGGDCEENSRKVSSSFLDESLWITEETERKTPQVKSSPDSRNVISDVTNSRRHRSVGEPPKNCIALGNTLRTPEETSDLDSTVSSLVSPYRSPSLYQEKPKVTTANRNSLRANRNSLRANWTPTTKSTKVTHIQGATCQYKTISTSFRDPAWKSTSGTSTSDSSGHSSTSRGYLHTNENNNNTKNYRHVEWRTPSSTRTTPLETDSLPESAAGSSADVNSNLKVQSGQKHSARVILKALGKKLFSAKAKSPGVAGHPTGCDNSSTSSSESAATFFQSAIPSTEDAAADLPPVAPVRPTRPTAIRRSRTLPANPRIKIPQRVSEPSPVRDRRKIFEQNYSESPNKSAVFGLDYSKTPAVRSKNRGAMSEVIPRTRTAGRKVGAYPQDETREEDVRRPVEDDNNNNNNNDGEDIGESTLEELDFLLKQYKDHDKRVKIRDTIRLLKENLQECDHNPARSPGVSPPTSGDNADVIPSTESESTNKADSLSSAKEDNAPESPNNLRIAVETPLSRFSARSTSLRNPKPSYQPPLEALNRASSFKLSRPKDFIIKKVDSSPQLSKVAESNNLEDTLNNNIPKYRVIPPSSPSATPQPAKRTVFTPAPPTAPNAGSYNKTASPFAASPKINFRKAWTPPKTDPPKSCTLSVTSQSSTRTTGPISPLRRSESWKENHSSEFQIPVLTGNLRRSKSILGRILGQRIDAERTPFKASVTSVGNVQLKTPSVLELEISNVTPTNKDTVTSPVEIARAQFSEPSPEVPKPPLAALSPCREDLPAFATEELKSNASSLSGSQSSLSSHSSDDSEVDAKGRVYDLEEEEFRSCSSDESPTLSQLVDEGKQSDDETEELPYSQTTTDPTESLSPSGSAGNLATQKTDDEVDTHLPTQPVNTTPIPAKRSSKKSDSENLISEEEEAEVIPSKSPQVEFIVGETVDIPHKIETLNETSAESNQALKKVHKSKRRVLPAIESHIVCETETVQFFNVQVIPPTSTKEKSRPCLPTHNQESEKSRNAPSSDKEDDVFSDSSLEEDADMDRYSASALKSRTSVKSQILATEEKDINGNTKTASSWRLRDRRGKPISTGDDVQSRIQKYKGQLNGGSPEKNASPTKRNGSVRIPAPTGKKLDVSKFEKGGESAKVDRDSNKTTVTLTTTAPRSTTRMTSQEEKAKMDPEEDPASKSSSTNEEDVKVDRDSTKTTVTLTTVAPRATTRMTSRDEKDQSEQDKDDSSRSPRGSRTSTSSADSDKKARNLSSSSQNDDSGRSRRARRAKAAEAEQNGSAKEDALTKLENASLSATADLKDSHKKKYGDVSKISTKSSRDRATRKKEVEPTADDSKRTNGDTNQTTANVGDVVEDSLSNWSARRRKKRERGQTDTATTPTADDAPKINADDDDISTEPIKTALHVRHSAPGEEILDSMVGYSFKLSRSPDKTPSRSSSEEEEKNESRKSSVADEDSDGPKTKQRSSRYNKASVSSILESDESDKSADAIAEKSGRLSGEDAELAEPEATEEDAPADEDIADPTDVNKEKEEETTEEKEQCVAVVAEELREDIQPHVDEIETEDLEENSTDAAETESKQKESDGAEIESDARESDKASITVYKEVVDVADHSTTQVSTDTQEQIHNSESELAQVGDPADVEVVAVTTEIKTPSEEAPPEVEEPEPPKRHRRHHKERKDSSEILEEGDSEKPKRRHHRKKHSETEKEGEVVDEKPRKKHHRKDKPDAADEPEVDAAEKSKKKHHRKKHSEVEGEVEAESERPRRKHHRKKDEESEEKSEEKTKKKHHRAKEPEVEETASEEKPKHKHRHHKEDVDESGEKDKEKRHKKHKDKESKDSKPEEVEAKKEEKEIDDKVEAKAAPEPEAKDESNTMHFSYDNIEEISDIALLEKMLAAADEYDHRRRIRSVLRALRKGEKPKVYKDPSGVTSDKRKGATSTPSEIARRGAVPHDSAKGVTRTTARTTFERTEKSDFGSRSVSIKTERSAMTSGSKKIGSIFDREDDEIKTTTTRTSGSSRLADLDRRQAERKRELQRNRSMPATSSKDARKAFVAKLEASSPKPSGNKKVGRSPTFVVPNANNVKQLLLKWCQSKTRGYEHVDIMNFSSSWASGMAFCALVHNFFPQAFDYNELDPKNRAHNFDLAFKAAEKYGDVAPLLEVEDMIIMGNRPDSKCVFTYVQFLYSHLRKYDQPLGPIGGGSTTKVVVKQGLEAKKLPESEDL